MKSLLVPFVLGSLALGWAASAVRAASGDSTTAADSDRPAVCFAPGTSSDVVADYARRGFGGEATSVTAPGALKHNLTDRWLITASGPSVNQGDPTVLTWSIVPDGTFIAGHIGEPAGNSDLEAFLDGLYGSSATWLPLIESVFDRWEELTGLSYVYEPSDDGAALNSANPGVLGVRGDLRIGGHFIDGNSNVLGYNFFPDTGDMVLDTADNFFNDTSNNSLRFRNVVSHEHGHGMGISHVCPINQTKLMEPFASTAFDGPQFDDILAGNRGYGDYLEHNDTSASATDSDSGEGNYVGLSVDDTDDENFFSFARTAGQSLTIVATPQGFTYLEGVQNPNGSCTPGSDFDALRIHDLVIDVLDTDGLTVLETANAGGLGESEILTFTPPQAGTYYARVRSDTAVEEAQLYDLSVGGQIFADGFESGDTSSWALQN